MLAQQMPRFNREDVDVLDPHRIISVNMRMSVATYSPLGKVSFDEAPEPETFLLMGSGLLGLALLGQRRRIRTKR